MANRRSRGPIPHKFSNKLLLNQWLISLFGIDPLVDQQHVRPFQQLAKPIKDPRLEGLGSDNRHKFYHELLDSDLLWDERCVLNKEKLRVYEQNIACHTRTLNKKRARKVVWKYYQWLTLLFVEIYLDRFFSARERLLDDLNAFVERFNRHWDKYKDVPLYIDDELNKLCLQCATGSGKTLLMHVNLLQYRHYATKHSKDKALSRVILLTPNEALSEQHIAEFNQSGLAAGSALQSRNQSVELRQVEVLEITKLADQEGPNTIATRSLGDNNLLLVDEGHRGMSGKEEGVWFRRRSALCAKGFSFEYSATFEQAVAASGNAELDNSYAKAVLFDYAYRWFYEDGFGKDYQILNLPKSFAETRYVYLTACLLKFYQQLRIFEEQARALKPFNVEKPLWVFVGSTVSSGKLNQDEREVASDVARIIGFIADFLSNRQAATQRMALILTAGGQDTGLLDEDGNDIFDRAFDYLAQGLNGGETLEALYRDILARLFNNPSGGQLSLRRIKGESGEVALLAGASETPFGLINVGDAKGLCDHVADVAQQNNALVAPPIVVEDSDFGEAMFASVKHSTSPVNLLIGSKKFVEGWDCWRVSTMGLMHVGRSEGAQIIQLFGRGVRLKGVAWSLKRSRHCGAVHQATRPAFIEALETLNVFGIEADYMERFRAFLKEQGLPGNERCKTITIPLNVTYDFGKKLKMLRPKRNLSDGKEYDFEQDAPVPTLGDIPHHMQRNPLIANWYPRIQAERSRATAVASVKDKVTLNEMHVVLMDIDALFFALEQFKRERGWRNFNITKDGIMRLLSEPTWYTLYLPQMYLNPARFDGVLLLQEVALDLLQRYCVHYYNYCKRAYLLPRLELHELLPEDDNIPQESAYQISVDSDETQLIQGIQQLQQALVQNKGNLLEVRGGSDLRACNFARHLFRPLLHVRHGAKISVQPVALNESEYRFVIDLKRWCDDHQAALEKDRLELFLLRNLSRGKGLGFFEAGNFHPDFILWLLVDGKQSITFIEPHGLLHEGPASEKVRFYKSIKSIEKRLNDPQVILNSFILSWTRYAQLQWGLSQAALEDQHILFMNDGAAEQGYICKLFRRLREGGG